MTSRIYVLSPRTFNYLKTRIGDDLTCERCGRSLRVGEKVVVRQGRLSKLKRYHVDCFSSMYYGDEGIE